MDSREAREILALYRPGSTDAAQPQMAEALEQVQRDPELSTWFEQHCAVHHAIRAKLKSVPIPPTLKRQIIVEGATAPKVTPFPAAARIVLAVAAVVALCITGWVYFNRQPDPRDFYVYRDQMARKVQRDYSFMQTNLTNQADLLQFFHEKNGPTNLVLSTTLQQLPAKGGSVLPWRDGKADMLCLEGGTPGVKNDLWVFVINKDALNKPPPLKPAFFQVYKMMTASWSTGDKIYVLVGSGTEKDLEKYLE